MFGYMGSDIAIGGSGQISRMKVNDKLISEDKINRACDLALLPFVGLEFFLGPKLSLSGEFGYDLSFKFYSKDKMTADNTTTITPHSTMVATNIGFGNSIRGGLRISYYF